MSALPLTGYLRIASLEKPISFIALSYVWGSTDAGESESSRRIQCIGYAASAKISHGSYHSSLRQISASYTAQTATSGRSSRINTSSTDSTARDGVPIEITQNCYAALQQIRASYTADGAPVSVWVDSICINQDNEEEKVDQIPLMLEIYGLAREVIVWLGPSNDKSAWAIKYLKKKARFGERIPLGLILARDADGKAGEDERKRLAAEVRKDIMCKWQPPRLMSMPRYIP